MNYPYQPPVDISDPEFQRRIFNAARNGKPAMATEYVHHLIAKRADPIRSTILDLQSKGLLSISKPGK